MVGGMNNLKSTIKYEAIKRTNEDKIRSNSSY